MHKVQSKVFDTHGGTVTEYRKYPYNWHMYVCKPLLHRLDGPAIQRTSSVRCGWWINGLRYEFTDYCKVVKPLISDEEYFTLLLTYGNNID